MWKLWQFLLSDSPFAMTNYYGHMTWLQVIFFTAAAFVAACIILWVMVEERRQR